MVKGADLVVMQLKAQGVEWISTLCGNGLDPLFDACRRTDLRVVDAHNEQAAAYMADAYARLTGRLGVCAVSSGIAHSNALTGLANAYFDGAPVLLITGASAGYDGTRGVFQEFDQVGLAAPICKFSHLVGRANDLVFLLREAISYALNGIPGPVHLTIPADVLQAEVQITQSTSPVVPPMSNAPDDSAVGVLAAKIQKSSKPVLVAGTGVFRSGGQSALARFSERLGVPFVIPIWDRGCVERPHPNFLGVVGAANGEPRVLEDADLLIMAGACVDYRVGFLSPPKIREEAFIAGIGSHPGDIKGGRVDLILRGDPSKILDQLSGSTDISHTHDSWVELCRKRRDEFRSPWVKTIKPREFMTGREIVDAIRPILSDELIFLIDGGNIGQWAHMALADHYPSRWLTCGASAVVGWGIPGAMAARLTFPERPILLLSGDGAFGFTLTELESAARQELPFVAVVANDSAWGIVVCGQKEAWEGHTIACETKEIRFDKAAEALGAKGLRVKSPEELTSAIRNGFTEDVPVVIDVPIRVKSPKDSKKEYETP